MSPSFSLPYARTLTHGPPTHPPPDDIPGLPSLADIRALDVLFDWDTLKGFIRDACVPALPPPRSPFCR